jgi:hypothetical protein
VSRRTVAIILGVSGALVIVGGILQLTTEGAARVAGQVAVMVATVGAIVGAIGSSFRDVRRE